MERQFIFELSSHTEERELGDCHVDPLSTMHGEYHCFGFSFSYDSTGFSNTLTHFAIQERPRMKHRLQTSNRRYTEAGMVPFFAESDLLETGRMIKSDRSVLC